VVCIVAKTNLKGKVYLFTLLMDAIDFVICSDRKTLNDFGRGIKFGVGKVGRSGVGKSDVPLI
jgi:hypothetical protein